MNPHASDDHRLVDLHPPRRNRYFFGKLLDASHLEMEQDYGRGADAQLGRLVLGAGVVCGLEVTPIVVGEQQGVRVSAGLALDGWGRRVVVPDDVDILPLAVTDDSGAPVAPGEPLPESVVIRLCYRECQTEYQPALVASPSCGDEQRSEAGTWIESYLIEVRAGTPAVTTADCSEAVLELVRADRLSEALVGLAEGACGDPPADPCTTLATVTVADGALAVDAQTSRAVVPTNVVLLRLIASLAARVDECWARTTPPTTSGPTPAPTERDRR